ncbi:MAG: DUF4147 domain-containing protein [Candidatus Tectomicrobia bacterium]|nr:DUF4147 domain-containing protein [Candidatus Tectomicrobia bacterium]
MAVRGGQAPRREGMIVGEGLVVLAERIFRAGLRAVDGEAVVRRALALCSGEGRPALLRVAGEERAMPENGRLALLSIGKAAAPMAAAAEAALGAVLGEGIVITKEGHALPLRRCQVFEAGHPLPDAAGVAATQAALAMVDRLGRDDLLLVLVSGGASALFVAPPPGLALAELQTMTSALLACGASIHELNTVRKHCSACAGGWLAARAALARIEALILSDVIGDDLATIASGPVTPDPSTFAEALEIVHRYRLRRSVPAAVVRHLEEGAGGRRPETPKPGAACFERVRSTIVANNETARRAAAACAASLGFSTCEVADPLQGEARLAALNLVELARRVRRGEGPVREPACLLAGGETTVVVRGKGRGGRNQECALAAVQGLAGMEGVALLCAGSDGSDGPTPAAGAVVTGETRSQAEERHADPRQFLARNDAYGFFARVGGHLITGPTRTNVMDLAILLLDRRAGAAGEADPPPARVPA